MNEIRFLKLAVEKLKREKKEITIEAVVEEAFKLRGEVLQ